MTDTSLYAPSRSLSVAVDPASVFAWIGGVSLFFLVFLVPPFQVPDEPQHFFRSYQLSKGEIWSQRQGDISGSVLPASLPALVERFMGTNALHTSRALVPQKLSDTLQELNRPLKAEQTVVVHFNTGSYAPVQYIPQALAIIGGRALDVGPLGLFYFARLGNALVAWVLTCVALRVFRFGGVFALVAALLPMSQFMTASCSPDAMTIASALLFASILTRFLAESSWSMGRWLTAFVSGTVMCSIKVVFIPLLFSWLAVLFMPGRAADPHIRRALFSQIGMAFLGIALIAGWFWSIQGTGGSEAPEGVSMGAQLAYLAQDPLKFVRIMARSFYFNGGFLWTSMIGYLGWLTLQLPCWAYWSIGLAFALGICSEPGRVHIPIAGIAWLMVLVACSIVLTELALYLTWTPVAAYKVEGVQGRYFIPVLPLVGFCLVSLFYQRLPSRHRDHAYTLLVCTLFVVTAATQYTIVSGYGLF